MKDRIIRIFLVIFIIVHTALPFIKLAMFGYDDVIALLSEVYKNGIVVILSTAILRLYVAKNK